MTNICEFLNPLLREAICQREVFVSLAICSFRLSFKRATEIDSIAFELPCRCLAGNTTRGMTLGAQEMERSTLRKRQHHRYFFDPDMLSTTMVLDAMN
jgi:hypothetical protein